MHMEGNARGHGMVHSEFDQEKMQWKLPTFVDIEAREQEEKNPSKEIEAQCQDINGIRLANTLRVLQHQIHM